jgi:GntR family transcriptional regulator, transcriptional repressor for pyruvate dehydrogenase complex
MSVTVVKPHRADLTRQCIDSIQAYISGQRLSPGDRLPSLQEWADMLGVSVVVVREAFRALEALGLVDIQHGRGIYVISPDDTDFLDYLAFRHSLDRFSLEEVIEGRAMLELAILETCIARADAAAIAELESILAELRADPPLAGRDSAPHKRFHQAMLKASGDRLLATIGMPLLNTFWVLGNAGQIELPEDIMEIDMVACHAAYVDAIKSRDLSHARELVDEHLFGLCSRYGIFPFAAPVPNAASTT